jgi:hypothetical protein
LDRASILIEESQKHMFGRIIAFLLLVGLVALAGSAVYNAGVTAGIAADVGGAIASGEPVPIGVYPGPYVGHPWGWGGWGWGGGFFGLLFGIFFLFLIFGLLRAAFGWGRWGGHRGWDGHKGDRGDHHRGPREYFDEWHREQHGEGPDKPAADKV